MNYNESVTDFFQSPKWFLNLLLAGLCSFIPFVGPMVVLGWLITGFWCRTNPTPETFPDFTFRHFVQWLQRGLWPMLAAIATSIGIYLIFVIPFLIAMSLLGAGTGLGILSDRKMGAAMGGLGVVTILGLELLLMLTMFFVIKPIMLRATLTQDFLQAFDFRFVLQFVSLTWLEMILSSLFLIFVSFVLGACGVIACCVGFVLVPGLTYFSMSHLDQQLYELYLSRGGEPIPISPLLTKS